MSQGIYLCPVASRSPWLLHRVRLCAKDGTQNWRRRAAIAIHSKQRAKGITARVASSIAWRNPLQLCHSQRSWSTICFRVQRATVGTRVWVSSYVYLNGPHPYHQRAVSNWRSDSKHCSPGWSTYPSTSNQTSEKTIGAGSRSCDRGCIPVRHCSCNWQDCIRSWSSEIACLYEQPLQCKSTNWYGCFQRTICLRVYSVTGSAFILQSSLYLIFRLATKTSGTVPRW